MGGVGGVRVGGGDVEAWQASVDGLFRLGPRREKQGRDHCFLWALVPASLAAHRCCWTDIMWQ